MTETMREKLARALCRSAGYDPDEELLNGHKVWRCYISEVDNILAVLAEPDEGMIEVAVNAALPAGCCDLQFRSPEDDFREGFTAAINHIRKGGKEGE